MIRVNRNYPGCWGDDHASAYWRVYRDIGAVVGPIRLFVCFSIALPIALVVGLLSFMGVVMVMLIAMGLTSVAGTDASDRHQKRSNAETLGKRHGRAFDRSDPIQRGWGNRVRFLARCD